MNFLTSINSRIYYGWVVVGATFLVLFAGFGVVYSFGAFFLALSVEFGAGRAAVSSIFSYAVFTLFITGAISGVIADRSGPKKVMAFGVVAVALGLLGAANAEQLWLVNLCFALGVGAGVGFVYIPAISTVQRWFVRRRGLASGIAVTGIGVGTMVMPIVAGELLETMTWRTVFSLMSILVLVSGFVAVALIEADPSDRGLAPDGDNMVSKSATLPEQNLLLWPILRSRSFVQFYLAQAVLSIAIFIPFVHLVPFAADLSIPRSQAVSIVGLIGLGSTAGRFLVGGVADRIGRRLTLVLLLAGIAVAYVIWLAANSATTLSIYAFVFGVFYGGYVALIPALLADYFNGPKLSSVIGLQYTASAAGSLLGPILAGYLFDRTGSYVSALVVAGICAACASYLIAVVPAQPTVRA
jgi:OFA family oxalate/formate antiporter-like MFS transporter